MEFANEFVFLAKNQINEESKEKMNTVNRKSVWWKWINATE